MLTDFTDLRGEAGLIAGIAGAAAAALGVAAAYFHRASTHPGSARKAAAPRLSKAQLLETLAASAENSRKAQEDAFRDVSLCDSGDVGGFAARYRRRATPTVDSVLDRFGKSLAVRDAALFEARSLREADVAYALRYYANDAAVRAAEASILATAPLAVVEHPVVRMRWAAGGTGSHEYYIFAALCGGGGGGAAAAGALMAPLGSSGDGSHRGGGAHYECW